MKKFDLNFSFILLMISLMLLILIFGTFYISTAAISYQTTEQLINIIKHNIIIVIIPFIVAVYILVLGMKELIGYLKNR